MGEEKKKDDPKVRVFEVRSPQELMKLLQTMGAAERADSELAQGAMGVISMGAAMTAIHFAARDLLIANSAGGGEPTDEEVGAYAGKLLRLGIKKYSAGEIPSQAERDACGKEFDSAREEAAGRLRAKGIEPPPPCPCIFCKAARGET